MSGFLRDLDHNVEQICWAEQTEIQHENFLREFEETVWPVFQRRGYTKDTALMYWQIWYAINSLQRIENLLEQDRI